jgi:hypothetical protein
MKPRANPTKSNARFPNKIKNAVPNIIGLNPNIRINFLCATQMNISSKLYEALVALCSDNFSYLCDIIGISAQVSNPTEERVESRIAIFKRLSWLILFS